MKVYHTRRSTTHEGLPHTKVYPTQRSTHMRFYYTRASSAKEKLAIMLGDSQSRATSLCVVRKGEVPNFHNVTEDCDNSIEPVISPRLAEGAAKL